MSLLSTSSNGNNETTTYYEVKLAIYDLSQGMAHNLSAQFLGPSHTIDIIPHTGIIVYGQEYFFGGGIQSTTPTEFRQSSQIYPINIQTLGRTSVSQQQFNEWCIQMMRNGQYSAASYDLMNRNCNNFSHDAAIQGLQLSQGVPDWILQVPQRFLSSPMGQMIRPMLEQMQVTGPMGNSSSYAPFDDTASSIPAVTSTSSNDSSQQHTAIQNNPWANNVVPERKTTSSNLTSNTSSKNETSADAGLTTTTPILDKHDKPLLSNDSKTVTLCVSKITASMDDDTSKHALEEFAKAAQAKSNRPTEDVVEGASNAILKHLEQESSNSVVFDLMLLRLVVLYPPKSLVETSSFTQCIKWVGDQLCRSNTDDADNNKLTSPAARSMGWCTLSNAVGTIDGSLSSSMFKLSLDRYVEAGMMDISCDYQPRVEVRQAAAAFLYNVVLSLSDTVSNDEEELPDILVSLLCGCLEGILDETDTTTKLRRLLVGGRIVRPTKEGGGVCCTAAKNLVVDLGFTEAISELANENGLTTTTSDEKKVKELAAELLSLIS